MKGKLEGNIRKMEKYLPEDTVIVFQEGSQKQQRGLQKSQFKSGLIKWYVIIFNGKDLILE